jgi:hypothetical protein
MEDLRLHLAYGTGEERVLAALDGEPPAAPGGTDARGRKKFCPYVFLIYVSVFIVIH